LSYFLRMLIITQFANLSVPFYDIRPADTQRVIRNFLYGFDHFRSDFIATCSLPTLQCLDIKEDIGCSDGIFLSAMNVL